MPSHRPTRRGLGCGCVQSTRSPAVDLPPTPWHHQRFWVTDRSAMSGSGRSPPAPGRAHQMPRNGTLSGRPIGTGLSLVGRPQGVRSTHHARPRGCRDRLSGSPETLSCSSAIAPIVIQRLRWADMPLSSHTPLTTQLIRGGDSQIRVEIYSRTWRRVLRRATAKS